MNTFSLLSFFSCMVYIYLVIYAFRLDAGSRLNRLFSYLCMCCALWSFCNAYLFTAPDKETAWFWLNLSSLGWAFIPGLALHFSLVLTGSEKKGGKWFALAVAYLPGTAFVYEQFTGYLMAGDFELQSYGWNSLAPVTSGWYLGFVLYYLGCLAASVALVSWWGRNSKLFREKKQARIIVAAMLASVILVFMNNELLPFLGIHYIPKMPSLVVLIWAFGMWYAISRYRFLNLTPAIATNQIISGIMDMLILTGPGGDVTRTNRRVEELLGYREGELDGKPVSEIVMEKDIIEDKMEKMLKGILPGCMCELTCLTKDGSPVPVSFSGSAIKDGEGDLAGIVIVAQDLRQTRQLQIEIAERKKMAETLIEANERLKELDKLKSDFLSTVSHELRTPLTSILGFTKIIKRKLEEEIFPAVKSGDIKVERYVNQVRQNVDIIVSEGERLTKLINDVLDIAKMEAGKVEWKTEPVSIQEVIRRALAATSLLFETKGLKLTSYIEEGLPPVAGDFDRLMQVMVNLLSNALKFTEEGTVTCRAGSGGDSITISVEDQGMGISEENRERVFEKFKQIGDTLTDKPKGTGLGLPICKQIVEKYGGRIWVEGRSGGGCVFSFTLPVIKDEDAAAAAYRPVPGGQPGGHHALQAAGLEASGKRILVADDDDNIRAYLRQELESAGYCVKEAEDGFGLITEVRKERPDLIILDVMMPGINGFDAAAVLKGDPLTRDIPVVILSIVEDQARGLHVGVDRYFTKPVNAEKLLAEIRLLASSGSREKNIS